MKYGPAILIFIFLTGCSSGGTWQHYRLSALDEARERNMTIYLHFYESGNATCEKQKTDLEKVIQYKKFAKVGAYRVTWDSEKGLQKLFGVQAPCTLLTFKGASLKTRITSDVGPELFERTLEQAL